MLKKVIEYLFMARPSVGDYSAGTAASRRHWTSLTVDASAPTLKTEGKETLGGARVLVTVKCVGGTEATFNFYEFFGADEGWVLHADWGTAGSYSCVAGHTERQELKVHAGVTRMHLQCVSKTLAPTEISGWLSFEPLPA